MGIEYSIADIATWPWIARFERHRIELKKYPALAKKPKYSVLNTYKTVQSFNVKTFGWKAALKFFLLKGPAYT